MGTKSLVTQSEAISVLQQCAHVKGTGAGALIGGALVTNQTTRDRKWRDIHYEVDHKLFSAFDMKCKHDDGRIRDARRGFFGDRFVFAAWAVSIADKHHLAIPDEWRSAIPDPALVLDAECRVDLESLTPRKAEDMVGQIMALDDSAVVERVKKAQRPASVYCSSKAATIAKLNGLPAKGIEGAVQMSQAA